jgi:hypothetical protein
MNPGLTIAAQVATAVGMTLGTNVFNGGVREIDGRVIFCLCHGGQFPDDIVGNLVQSYQRPRVQIRIREDQENFGSGETLARSVRDSVHLKVPAGYIDCRAVESSPLYLGQDDFGRHEWSINVELTIKE